MAFHRLIHDISVKLRFRAGKTSAEAHKECSGYRSAETQEELSRYSLADAQEEPPGYGSGAAQGLLGLDHLPTELIASIAEFLSQVSAAIFSLCSQRIRLALGNKYKYVLRSKTASGNDTFCKFLDILERDIPDHIACCHCKTYHDMRSVCRYMARSDPIENWCHRVWYKKLCGEMDGNMRVYFYICRWFSSTLFRTAMKRYRQGRDYESLLSSLLLGRPATMDPTNGCPTQVTRISRIVDGRLILREPYICLTGLSECRRKRISHMMCGQCPHGFISGDLDETGNIKWNYDDGLPHLANQQVYGCSHCYKDMMVDTKLLRDTNGSPLILAAVVTTWKDLGDGRLCNDPYWLCHIVAKDGERCWDRVHREPGSVYAAFENGDQYNIDKILIPTMLKGVLAKIPGDHFYSAPGFIAAL